MSARGRNERGAIAVVMAVSMIVMLGFAAMVVDLGLARDVRRQAQNASDASALAAGNQLYLGTSTPRFTEAVQAAKDYALANYGVATSAWSSCTDSAKLAYVPPGSTPCISFDQQAKPTKVRVLVPTRSVGTPFATVFGVDDIDLAAMAEALVVPGLTTVSGLRPWGICSEMTPTTMNTSVTMVFFPGNGHTSTNGCSATNAGGNWWLMKCPDDNNGGVPATSASILNGCAVGVRPVPNQPTDNTLAAYLKQQCISGRTATTREYCLEGDTGNNLQVFSDEWQTLVGETITMPVFCDMPACTTSTVRGNGTNAVYPVWKIATVEVCGFKLGGDESTGWPGGSDSCTTKNTQNYKPSDFGKKEDGFFLVFKQLQGSSDFASGGADNLHLTK